MICEIIDWYVVRLLEVEIKILPHSPFISKSLKKSLCFNPEPILKIQNLFQRNCL